MFTIYTDGACSGNPGPGGWCAVIENGDDKTTIYGSEDRTTNNRMELTAVIKALEHVPFYSDVTVVSDSKYICDAVNQNWITKWSANGWRTSSNKPVANQDLWTRFFAIFSKMNLVKCNWVQGHNGHPQNEECDRIASALAQGGDPRSANCREERADFPHVYTHNEAADIVDLFESVLDKYNITVPSPEDDEKEPDNMARLYGTVYYGLLDAVEDVLVNMAQTLQNGARVTSYVFS